MRHADFFEVLSPLAWPKPNAMKVCALIAAALALASGAFAQGELPINGVYRAGRPCRSSDTRLPALLITITDRQIIHPGGVCTIDSKSEQGNTAILRTTCNDKQGKTLSGEVTFTVYAGHKLGMRAAEGSYKALLNPCPENAEAHAAGKPDKAEAAQ